jgi:hypothetical protein
MARLWLAQNEVAFVPEGWEACRGLGGVPRAGRLGLLRHSPVHEGILVEDLKDLLCAPVDRDAACHTAGLMLTRQPTPPYSVSHLPPMNAFAIFSVT